MSSKYVDSSAVIQVLGSLYNNPKLLDNDDKYFFSVEDFPERFHKIIFRVIVKLKEQGVEKLDLQVVNDFLERREKSKRVYDANQGDKYLLAISKNANSSAFDYYYDRLKKFSLLRAYNENVIDVSFLYDIDNILDEKKKQEQEEWLDSTTLEAIALAVDDRIEEIKSNHIHNIYDDTQKAGNGIFDLISKYEETPAVGVPLYGNLINMVTRGARLGKMFLRSAATGSGKALPNNMEIPTPEGWKKVKEIKKGDYLFDREGKPTKVLEVFPQQEKKQVYKIIFKDDREIECSGDHLWTYRKETDGKYKIYTETTKEILNKAKKLKGGFKQEKKGGSFNFSIPLNKPVEYPKKQYYIPPYSFGAMLGDGSFRVQNNGEAKSFLFSSEDEEIPKRIAEECGWYYRKQSKTSKYTWIFKEKEESYKNIWVQDILKDYEELINVKSEDKFIPEEYLYGSIEQRFDLLAGLLDTDGSVSKEGGRITFFTTSTKLMKQFIDLCHSLGMIANSFEDKRKEKYSSKNGYYICIQCNPEIKLKLFKLTRKKQKIEEWLNNGKKKIYKEYLPIVNIEPLNKYEDMTCFLVDNEEHLFLCKDFIVTHNTRTMIADVCYMACDKIYELDKGWIKNGIKIPVAYIATEQELDEIQTMMLAFVSGVNEEHILMNNYEFGEKDRVLEAAKIISESPIYVTVATDFSLSEIEMKIKSIIREKNIHYVFFDYLKSTLSILEEITKKSGGVKLREDNVLFMMSCKLKDICVKYNVFILTSTQLSGNIATSDTPDQSLLRGAKSIADSCDYGSIMLRASNNDQENLRSIIDTGIYSMPDMKISVYKNRQGKYKGIYLWCKSDLGTCRINPMFATTWNYELIEMKDLKIEVEENKETFLRRIK